MSAESPSATNVYCRNSIQLTRTKRQESTGTNEPSGTLRQRQSANHVVGSGLDLFHEGCSAEKLLRKLASQFVRVGGPDLGPRISWPGHNCCLEQPADDHDGEANKLSCFCPPAASQRDHCLPEDWLGQKLFHNGFSTVQVS